MSCNFYIYWAVFSNNFLFFFPYWSRDFIRMYSMQYSEKPKVPENIFRIETFYK